MTIPSQELIEKYGLHKSNLHEYIIVNGEKVKTVRQLCHLNYLNEEEWKLYLDMEKQNTRESNIICELLVKKIGSVIDAHKQVNY